MNSFNPNLPALAKEAIGRQHGERPAQLGGHWEEITDEFPEDARDFQERHYAEFVTFMPNVQRFLYGDATGTVYDGSLIGGFRRRAR